MKKKAHESGPMPWTRRRAHSGQSLLKGWTANSCWSTKPRTKTGRAADAAVTTVVMRSLIE
jgi:hypothetical protein